MKVKKPKAKKSKAKDKADEDEVPGAEAEDASDGPQLPKKEGSRRRGSTSPSKRPKTAKGKSSKSKAKSKRSGSKAPKPAMTETQATEMLLTALMGILKGELGLRVLAWRRYAIQASTGLPGLVTVISPARLGGCASRSLSFRPDTSLSPHVGLFLLLTCRSCNVEESLSKAAVFSFKCCYARVFLYAATVTNTE